VTTPGENRLKRGGAQPPPQGGPAQKGGVPHQKRGGNLQSPLTLPQHPPRGYPWSQKVPREKWAPEKPGGPPKSVRAPKKPGTPRVEKNGGNNSPLKIIPLKGS